MKTFQGEFTGSVKLNKIQLNEDMLQRIDVIVYHVETGCSLMMGDMIDIIRMGLASVETLACR